jgi:WD40-like Beta Propeller Repeat
MRTLFSTALLLVLTTGAAPSQAEKAGKERFAPVADLAGFCWIGTFDNGGRDVHCYDWALQEGFLRDRHQVTGGEGVYAGETFYGWDEAAGRLHYWYFNTLGGVSEGDAVRAEDGRWTFAESYQGGGGSLELRTAFHRPDDGSYAIVTEVLRDGAWVPEREVVYRRFDVRPAATGGPWSEKYDLVFSTDRGESYDVYRRDLRTGVETPLAAAPDTEWVYVASGDELVVVSNRSAGAEGGYRLYRMDAGGGEMEQIADFPVADSWVGVLPGDGGYVVCAAVDGDQELVHVDRAGAIVARLTDDDFGDCQPDVTPDGKTVVFWSDRSGSGEIWAMAIDGTNPRRLTDFPGNDGVGRHRYGGEGPPRVSPAGDRIVWMSIRDGEDWDVYTMALDGSDVRRLTDHLAEDGYPSWSPDGRWLAFDSDRGGSYDLWVMPADGSAPPQRVTDHPGSEQAPAWVPRQ